MCFPLPVRKFKSLLLIDLCIRLLRRLSLRLPLSPVPAARKNHFSLASSTSPRNWRLLTRVRALRLVVANACIEGIHLVLLVRASHPFLFLRGDQFRQGHSSFFLILNLRGFFFVPISLHLFFFTSRCDPHLLRLDPLGFASLFTFVFIGFPRI